MYLSDLGYDESSGVYSIDICVRIDDSGGNFLGVLKGIFNVAELIDLVQELSQSDDNGFAKNVLVGHEGHKTMEYL